MLRARAFYDNERDSTEVRRRTGRYAGSGFRLAKHAGRKGWKMKTPAVKIPRFSKRLESKAGVCSVDAARHPPFCTGARVSQGQARSNPPRELGSSLTSRYDRPHAIKTVGDRMKTILVKRPFQFKTINLSRSSKLNRHVVVFYIRASFFTNPYTKFKLCQDKLKSSRLRENYYTMKRLTF